MDVPSQPMSPEPITTAATIAHQAERQHVNLVEPKKSITPAPHANEHNRRWYVPWIVASTMCFIAFVALLVLLPDATWFAWRQLIAQYILRSDYVIAKDASFERPQYIVPEASLRKPGYIVLFLGSPSGVPRDAPLAETALLPAGVYKNIQVHIDPINIPEVRPLVIPGATVFVTLYYDNGDGEFDSHVDIPVKDALGNPVLAKLTIL